MNKSELVEAIANHAGLDRRTADAAVSAFVDSVISATRAGDKVSIVGFGTFNPTSRAARTGRNPQTGAPVQIRASKGVRFAAGAGFKSALNSGAGKKAATAKKTSSSKKSSAKKATAKKATAGKAAKSTKKR